MADWTTISALATAGGTLVLAVATFASVRSANGAARTAERTLQAGLRPLLFPSRFDDPVQKVTWVDDHLTKVTGGRAAVEVTADVIYLTMSLRNVGSGIAVLHAWYPMTERPDARRPPPAPDTFRRLTRDLYVPPGDTGFWQGAIREPDDPHREPLARAIAGRQPLFIELLYGDLEGGQRTITLFNLTPLDEENWLCSVARHWNLDRADPR
ncbi:MAG: hypothetical protein E6J14_11790 [Chloroflexi bacterium]|nr:MAG: hypothetical protein E6J14_11790 [Chloroflexota bacterium]